MTCLKYLAQCPCPRCLIAKSRIPRLGMQVDKRARQKLIRVDSEAIQNTITLARRRMFQDGINITSVVVDRLLKPKSLVPTHVSLFSSFHNPSQTLMMTTFHRTLFLFDSPNMDSTFTKSSYQISCMNLNLVFGKLSSRT